MRSWRRERAQADGVPAYVVLTNATLEAVCRSLPADEDELLAVPGMGPARVERYARELLELVSAASPDAASRRPLPV